MDLQNLFCKIIHNVAAQYVAPISKDLQSKYTRFYVLAKRLVPPTLKSLTILMSLTAMGGDFEALATHLEKFGL